MTNFIFKFLLASRIHQNENQDTEPNETFVSRETKKHQQGPRIIFTETN